MAQPFFGRYLCPLDEKNRAVLPLRLRQAIEPELLEEGFVVTEGLDGCLAMFTRAKWRELLHRYGSLEFGDRDACDFLRFFFSSAQEVAIDRIGRVMIADFQREACGIDRELMFSGMNDHIEIWAPAKWEKWRQENLSRYPEVANRLRTGRPGPPGGGPGTNGSVPPPGSGG
jgi:transcriptional regulator MraZ